MSLAQGVLRGDTRATGKLISLIENQPEAAVEALQELHPHTGNAHVVGITGPPGAGKSTLTEGLGKLWRADDRQVGIVAVDPNSPFSGGALLGDRVRMQELATDPGVFIRSMGARGQLGGLSRAIHNVIRVLDAAGKDVIFVETVGVGQSEVDIAGTADTVVLALMPGMGDGIQTIKAGILEIADVFVINKADRPGVRRLQMELEMLLDWNCSEEPGWRPPVQSTVANTGTGVEGLKTTIVEHAEYLRSSGELERRRRGRYQAELQAVVEGYWRERFFAYWQQAGQWEAVVEQLLRKETDPFTAARELLQPFLDAEKGG
ncbi:MAG: methylmalonyl Co-A mutase-associated GTPase MeaB [Spirochaetaceae bacterium]